MSKVISSCCSYLRFLSSAQDQAGVMSLASVPIRNEPYLPMLRALTLKPRPTCCQLVSIPFVVGLGHLWAL
eukprot:1140593-Pelagomonas_calceolata.AAC.5